MIAVNDVSFDVRAREIVALIGPNGAGKSTTTNLITGVLATGGRLRFSARASTAHRRRSGQTRRQQDLQHVKLVPT